MTASELEQIIRRKFVGSHRDSRRFIGDLPVGYLQGRKVAGSNIFDLSLNPEKGVDSHGRLVLGNHYHEIFDELFVLGRGRGIVVAQRVRSGEEHVELEFNSYNPEQRIIYLPREVAHVVALEPGSFMVGYILDAPEGFNPSDLANNIMYTLLEPVK